MTQQHTAAKQKQAGATSARLVMRYYWRHLRRYPLYVAGLLMAVPAASIMNAFVPPLIIASIIQKLTLHQYTEGAFLGGLGSIVGLYAFVAIFSLGF
ncbi:hypothetical protein CSA80_00140 [Candidatus Saccharibacteria bacterium]|nr:MAG: hypothetical protein CSA80_00140 [Candidatus Saccharibacteria bacterium]